MLAQLGSNPELDVLVITHPDADHYNLVEAVLEGVEVHKVLHVGGTDEYPKANFTTWLDDHPNRTSLTSDDFDPPNVPSVRFGEGDVKFHVLSADIDEEPSRTNSRSIVLRVSCGNFEAILTGDGTFATENKILERYNHDFLDVELLKLGHHGSSTTSTSDPWLAAVRPEMAIASAGYYSAYQHPRKSVIDAAADFTLAAPQHPIRWGTRVGGQMQLRNKNNYGEAIYSTAKNGNIVVTSDGQMVAVQYEGGTTSFAASPSLAPQPRFAPVPRRAVPAPSIAREAAAPPPSLLGGRESGVALPFDPGQDVELITRDNISVAGRLQPSAKPGWVHLTEPATNRTVYVLESQIVIVKSAEQHSP